MNNQIKELKFKAKDQAYSLLEGTHLSRRKGDGYSFYELREYQIGDDVNKINWIASAKLGKTYVKEMHSSKELSVTIVNLLDGSLYFGQNNLKQQKIVEITATIAYATILQGDTFQGLSVTNNETHITPRTKNQYFINNFIDYTYEANVLHTKLDYSNLINELSKKIHKPSLLFIISDFLEDIDLSIISQKHDTVAVIVRDEKEENFDELGEMVFTNPYVGESQNLYVSKSSIQKYLINLQKHDEKLYAHLKSHNIRFTKILTSDSTLRGLQKLFN